MKGIHGGDIYRNRITLDFSVNINPLGIPEQVKAALHEAVDASTRYPDIEAEALKSSVSRMTDCPEEYLLFGNGASEVFMAIVHALKPRKVVIPVPSFFGYEYAAGAVCDDIIYYPLCKENQFTLDEKFMDVLSEDIDLIFLANPNNPTGQLLDRAYLIKLIKHCLNKHIYVVLDECFIEFCRQKDTLLSEIEFYDNLLLVRAFTKIFAIPGVRLGYLVSSNRTVLGKIRRQLPEWNLSTFAQTAGRACAKQTGFIEKTAHYIRTEREFLAKCLRQLGFHVFDSHANFVLLYSELPLYEKLLERGILIRDCQNFRGLEPGYYRVAVRGRKDNEILLKTMGELL